MKNSVEFEGVVARNVTPDRIVIRNDDAYIIVETRTRFEEGARVSITGRLNSVAVSSYRPMVITTIVPDSIEEVGGN